MKFMIFSGFRDKRRYIIYTLLFLLVILILFTLFANNGYYEYQINYVSGAKRINREIEAEDNKLTNDIDDFIKNKKYVSEYYPVYDNIFVIYNDEVYEINYKNNQKIDFGRDIKNNSEMVLSSFGYLKLNLSEDDLGKTFDFFINNKHYNFTFVGVTNDKKSHIYLSREVYEKIFELSPTKYNVLIDEFPNVSRAINEFESNGYYAGVIDTTGYKEIEKIREIENRFLTVFIVAFIVLFVFLSNLVKSIFNMESKNIAIYKVIGFKNSKIFKIVFSRIFLITCLSFLLAIFLNLIMLPIYSLFKLKFINLFSVIKWNSYAFLVIVLFLDLNVIKFAFKIVKMDVLESFQEE